MLETTLNLFQHTALYKGLICVYRQSICNAFDTSSLLIALLRASNIPAKYVQGTVELPIEKVKNWVGGFTDSNSALSFIASGGIPVGGITEGGQIKYVQMEHVSVEAWVDMIPSQGAINKDIYFCSYP